MPAKPQRIAPEDSAFTRFKGRRPRTERGSHLKFIRSLPCLLCGSREGIHAAHIRMGHRGYGKRETGMGEKPSDQWTLPLCQRCHERQHCGDEMTFWARLRIDPFKAALSLFAASGDEDTAELVIREARR